MAAQFKLIGQGQFLSVYEWKCRQVYRDFYCHNEPFWGGVQTRNMQKQVVDLEVAQEKIYVGHYFKELKIEISAKK